MAKVCYFTGRKTVSGNNRSHAMNQTKRAVKLKKFGLQLVPLNQVKLNAFNFYLKGWKFSVLFCL